MVEQEKITSLINDTLLYLDGNRSINIEKSFINSIENNSINAKLFKEGLDLIREELKQDIEYFMVSDPAADSEEEVKISYPGFKAITYYRIAHIIRNLGYKLESRIISEIAHSSTGIDIHPGATIGVPFFIDHGTGIVIGETTIIGKYVKIYQGVTLGALSLRQGSLLKGTKRHPTIGDQVTIYSGASILGNIKIGNDVTIGSNVFLMDDVESGMNVTIGKPILVVRQKEIK